MNDSDWFLLGAPWDSSGRSRGEEQAPDALRAAGLRDLINVDCGDAATHIGSNHRDDITQVRALPDTVTAAHTLAATLRNSMRDHPQRRPLVVGGDCSLLLGVFAQLSPALNNVGLWLVDGHPDYLAAADSETGETADLELAVLTGDGPAELIGLAGTVPMMNARHAALIGHRTVDLDPDSAAELARLPSGLFTIDAPQVLRDPAGAGGRAADWASRLGLPMWLHLDVDVLDPSVMPAVTYPQDGGLDFDQLAAVLAPLAASPNLAGVSVADFRPDLDPDGRHADDLVRLLDSTL
ncbi:arginase family protein [Solwaraspora sp. WMMD406]|uniref:arginase family protein n=1 Tax=Solwaraspora sp. WMMD406 TaxID=3016095 RepID=UPI002417BB79|nr:arginase family protein [Solwaraspora sp. WMMD406]MDG4763608.1 arginase family protein [Solwaraspora sp. WMMD406]